MFTRNDFHYFIEPGYDPDEEAKIKNKIETLMRMVHDKLPRQLKENLIDGVGKYGFAWGYLTEKEPPVYSVHFNAVIHEEGLTVGVLIDSVKLLPKFLKNVTENRKKFLTLLKNYKDCKITIVYGIKKEEEVRPSIYDVAATLNTNYVDDKTLDFILEKLAWTPSGRKYPRIKLSKTIYAQELVNLEIDKTVSQVVDIIKLLEPYYRFCKG